MIHHRDEFISNLTKALGRPRPTELPVRPTACNDRPHQVMAGDDADLLLAHFTSYCQESLEVPVLHCSQAMLSDTLLQASTPYCQREHASIMLSSDPRLGRLLDNAVLEPIATLWYWENQAPAEENIRRTEESDLGIVWAEQALTESGTMVLYSNPRQGRSISLLPPASIFVVAKSNLCPRITQATDQLHHLSANGERLPSCVNFISGPSSTADIELVKVVGVHGPMKATYIVIDDL